MHINHYHWNDHSINIYFFFVLIFGCMEMGTAFSQEMMIGHVDICRIPVSWTLGADKKRVK